MDAELCHLAEDSELASSQPLAEAGTWSSCYGLLLSKGLPHFFPWKILMEMIMFPRSTYPHLEPHTSAVRDGNSTGYPGLAGSRILLKVEPHISGRIFQSHPVNTGALSIALKWGRVPISTQGLRRRAGKGGMSYEFRLF